MISARVIWEARIASFLAIIVALMTLSGCSALLPALGAAAMLQGTTSIQFNVGEAKAGVKVKLPKIKMPVMLDDIAGGD